MTQPNRPSEPVLVVEDNDDNREILGTLLEVEGYGVTYAVDGRDALDQLERGLRPCLILLDVSMPRMNGIEFRRAQVSDERFSEIPVILFSAVHEITWLYPALDAPLCRKPVEVDRILQLVAERCASRARLSA
jgi:two-component system, chemotaxis family, chemotaxis protein CheY